MRITIEMTEAERRSTTIRQDLGGAVSAEPGGSEAPAVNGGSPPEPLLIALGAMAGPGAEESAPGRDTNAGEPPSWLVNVITGGGELRST